MSRILLPIFVFTTVAALLVSCGAGQGSDSMPSKEPIDFSYSYYGEVHRLWEHRGQPLVLVLVRSSEVVSLLYMDELAKIYDELGEREVPLLVLTVEATEEPFLEQFVEFNELPFDIGIAERRVVLGKSPLGLLPIIPVTYLINKKGRITTAHAGAINSDNLLRAVRAYFRK